jgi:hypothetical protein
MKKTISFCFLLLALVLSGATAATAATILVTSTADSGVGSLRNAINNASDGDVIRFDPTVNWTERVVTLSSYIWIYTTLSIEGNGVTLSGNNLCGILEVGYSNYSPTVNVSRVHFTNGNVGSYAGGAIYMYHGLLNLQSCIFSNNTALYSGSYGGGGAIHNEYGTLNVSGCTFYNNVAYRGGAISLHSGSAVLIGNLFYGNTAYTNGSVVYKYDCSVISGGYNVYDGSSYSYYSPTFSFNVTGDKQVSSATFNPDDFRPTASGKEILQIIPSGLANFPTTDFYGSPRSPYPTATGAVKAAEYHKVTFDLQTGDSPTTVLVADNMLIPASAIPVRDGFAAIWYTEAEYIHAWDFAHTPVTQDTTLYAQWKAAQTITWNQDLLKITLDTPPIALNATASSELPITYESSNPAVASVAGNVLTIAGEGQCTITAIQAGNDTYQRVAMEKNCGVYAYFAPPVVGAATVSHIGNDSVRVAAAIADAGMPVYTERGFCYGTSSLPSVSGSRKTVAGSETGNFTTTLKSLTPNTMYYVRAYATNPDTTVYGAEAVFVTHNNSGYFQIEGHGIAVSKPSFVKILFSVKDQNGLGEDQLSNEHFEVLDTGEDMMSQSEAFPYIRQMETIPFKIKTILMLDYSLSMDQDNKIQDLKAAAARLIRNKDDRQEFAIYRFASNTTLIQDFTPDTTLLLAAVRGIPELGPNSTNLYGAYIEGIGKLPEEYHSIDSIQQCFMVVFTDGEDTRHNTTLAEAQSSHKDEDVFIIGPNSMNPASVAGLGTFYGINNISEVTEKFTRIQIDMLRDANSNYLLTYMSPRGSGTFPIDVRIRNNTNTHSGTNHYSNSYTTTGMFDAADVIGGVYILPYGEADGQALDLFGLEDGYNFYCGAPGAYDLTFVTYWATLPPVYHWRSSNPEVADVEYDSKSEFEKARLIIKQSAGSATITLVDTANVLCVQNGQASIPPNFAGLYRRTIRVSGMATGIVDDRAGRAPAVSPTIFDRQVQISGAEGSVLKIFNLNGAGVHTQPLVTNDETLRLEHLPAGMYIFCIEQKGETTRTKAIKR